MEKRETVRASVEERKMAKRRRNVLLLMLEIICVLVLCLGGYAVNILNSAGYESLESDVYVATKTSVVEHTNESGSVVATEQVTVPVVDATYRNILILGVDQPEEVGQTTGLSGGVNSDVIIILSINQQTGEVRMASVLRDTIVKLEAGTRVGGSERLYDKVNSQFCYAGISETVSMINHNLDLNIQEYVTVNWAGVAKTIDELGGLEIDVDEKLIGYLNGYLTDVNEKTGIWSPQLEHGGLQTLTGTQVVAFCRIRYGGVEDEGRAEHHRIVIGKAFERVKALLAAGDYNAITQTVQVGLTSVKTNISNMDLIGLATNATSFTLGPNYQFPQNFVTGTYLGDIYKLYHALDVLVAKDFAQEVTELHKFLFDDNDYVPSDFVKEVSAQEQKDAGFTY